MRRAIETRRVGFTLIELLVVIAIIGLVISLILVASNDGVRRAEERATQSLITKLETAVNDRIDALLNTQPPINQTHRLLAAINTPVSINGMTYYVPLSNNSSDRRAQVIAQFDYLRAELPDVFFLNSQASGGSTIASAYPINFAAAPYPAGTNSLTSTYTQAQDGGSWVLPLGNNYGGLPGVSVNGVLNGLTITPPQLPTTGMFGASFSAAASLYKSLYTAAAADLGVSVNFEPGLDGVDNNNDGLIDELISPTAGTSEIAVTGSTIQAFSNAVAARLAKHTHKTARSEMLYALLVNGLSPLGSAFSPDDFTAREVQDTDGDGLPEFIDAWGEPLQFFRWPIYYGGPLPSPPPVNGQPFPPVILGTSDSQKGYNTYGGPSEARQQDELDPNQLLVSPGWWTSAANPYISLKQVTFSPPNGADTSNYPASPGAIAFMNYFHSIVDPSPGASGGVGWDRGGSLARREYFTKVLILSAGPDKEPGVAQFAKDYSVLLDSSPTLHSPYVYTFPNSQATIESNALALIYIENQAAVSDPTVRSGAYYQIPDFAPGASPVTQFLSNSANSDDITNHNISGISTGVR